MVPSPLPRREQQRRTRDAVVREARFAFARDGYHAANLAAIARAAGFSKGAGYSNFSSKAELFLAVVDENLEVSLRGGGWDVSGTEDPRAPCVDEEVSEVIEGFALATLEFIASAARDERLSEELGRRMSALITGYEAVARESTSVPDALAPGELGALLAAIDQGAALLTLSGISSIDQRLLRLGMRRLLSPASADEPEGAKGDPALHNRVVRERIADALGPDATPSS